jgi:hypothetical protein
VTAYLFVLIIGLLAGALSGIIGTGSSIVLLPILAFQFGPQQAVPIMAIAALMSNVAVAACARERTDRLRDRHRDLHRAAERAERQLPERVTIDPEKVERDLARLVLGVVELLCQWLERQAVRRVENGTLSDDEIERLGETLLKLETRMSGLKTGFGLGDQDLSLELGPLRDLV